MRTMFQGRFQGQSEQSVFNEEETGHPNACDLPQDPGEGEGEVQLTSLSEASIPLITVTYDQTGTKSKATD